MARRRRTWVPAGALVIAKPAGPTSHDIVDYVRRLAPRGAKVGHTGTLDPFAEGVLVVCLGGATRLADRVQSLPKTYRARLDLRSDTDTGDPTGEVVAEHPRPEGLDRASLEAAAAAMVGPLEQVPPAYSAIKIDGERAYARARRGEVVEVPARTVTIHALEVLAYDWPFVDFRVRCSKGTYVRTLGTDLGRAVGAGGHLVELVREAVGDFRLEDARTPFDLVGLARLEDAYVPLEGPLGLDRVDVGPADVAALAGGGAVPASEGAPGEVLVYPAGEAHPLALARRDGSGVLRPSKVFGTKG